MTRISGSSPSGSSRPPSWDDVGAGTEYVSAGPAPGAASEAGRADGLSGDLADNADLQSVVRGERDLGRGSEGESIQLVQEQLFRAGIAVRGGIDGVFGRGTESAIAAFQRSVGQDPTGRLDRETLLALDDAETKRALPAPSPLTGSPQSYLHTGAERDAYEFIERKVWTGASWRRGIDAAVTDDDTRAVLDRLDTLGSEAYANVLHALAATKIDEPLNPTVLDKLIRRGTSQMFNVRLSARFGQQMIDKLGNAPIPDKRVLSHISRDNVSRLRGWASWETLVDLFS